MTASTVARTTGGAPKRPRFSRDWRIALLYLLPAFIVMGIITFFPLAFQVYISFTDFAIGNLRPGAPPAPWVGPENYQRIIESSLGIPNFHFVRQVIYNLWWALSNVAIHVVLGVAVALLLNIKGLWLKRFWRALYIVPVVIPPIIVATVWRNMFDTDHGAVNELLAAVGGVFRVPAETFRIDWLRQSEDVFPFLPSDISYFIPLAFFALLIANTWLGWPLNAVVATGALQSIPGELYEAAEMDGAGNWQKFKNVTLVYLKPAMIPYAIYGFVITFNLFFLAYFMSNGGPFGRTEQLVTQAFRLVNEQRLYGIGAAFAVIMFFILLVLTVITNRMARATASYDR
jgi:arabinogalactan oligomer / maltooligosaccharide transport system permease protein